MSGPIDHKMDFFTKDFLASTLEMSGPERAAYCLSLVVAWTQDASLPADPDRIRRAIGFGSSEWRKVWPALELKWPLAADGDRRVNRRQAEEWEKAAARTEALSDAGRKASAMRWGKRPHIRSQSPSPSPSPSEEKREKERFAPPSLEEVRKYGEEVPGLDAAAFHDFYASKGWKVGSQPMRDWKAAARNWRRRDAGNGKDTPRVVIHRNQADLDREREGDEIARNRAAATRAREEREGNENGWLPPDTPEERAESERLLKIREAQLAGEKP